MKALQKIKCSCNNPVLTSYYVATAQGDPHTDFWIHVCRPTKKEAKEALIALLKTLGFEPGSWKEWQWKLNEQRLNPSLEILYTLTLLSAMVVGSKFVYGKSLIISSTVKDFARWIAQKIM